MKIKIDNQFIGEDDPCFIIAEAGSNYDQDIDQAKKLIDIAAQAGVNAIKFQIYKADMLVPQGHPAFSIIKRNEFPRKWVKGLFEYSCRKGLIFLASPFDNEAVDLLDELGVAAFKCASPEIFDYTLLKHAAAKGKPMILSTGMCSIADIKPAVDVIERQGNNNIVLLHCVSCYPTQPEHANLRMMDDMRGAFRYPIGFSDHTMDILTPVIAVSRQACVIEKHFTISRDLKGPDHAYALEPDELAKMVLDIRFAEKTFGSSIKRHVEGVENPRLHQKCLAAKVDIAKGEKITEDKIMCLRGSEGINSSDLDRVIGRSAIKDIGKYEILSDAAFAFDTSADS